MKDSYLLGVDIGTTGTKVVLLDIHENITAEVTLEQHLSLPHPGWAEEDPSVWWENTVKGIQHILKISKIDPSTIKGIGVSGMVPALVLLDEKGTPLRPSIQQNDARTSQEIKWMKANVDEKWVFKRTGGFINQQNIGPKLRWLKINEPGVFKRIKTVLGSYDYINYCLSGNFSLEQNWALESGLFDIKQKDWIGELLELSDFKRELFPPVFQPHQIIGHIQNKAARLTGLREGTPIVAGSADHVASALAAGLENEGDALIKFGSAGDILFCLDSIDTDPRLFIDYHDIPGKFLINGCMATSGAILKWFVEQFCSAEADEAKKMGGNIYEILDKKVENIPPGSNELILLPYFLGEKTPIMNPLARGVLFGLTLHHRRENIYKAILESVIYGFQHHFNTLSEKGHKAKKIMACNGGARSRIWLKIAADVIGEKINYISKQKGSVVGAAFVAGMGVDCFKKWNEIQRYGKIDKVIIPDRKNHSVYEDYFKLYKQIYIDLKDRFVQIEKLSRRSQNMAVP